MTAGDGGGGLYNMIRYNRLTSGFRAWRFFVVRNLSRFGVVIVIRC